MFLALDTSTLILSLALVQRETAGGLRPVEVVELGPPRKQSELLPGAMGELLARHGVRFDQLEGIALGLGPGSFTGLRIGMASAKALAYAARIRLAGVSSLAAVALQGPSDRTLLVTAVARVGELYVGTYRRSEGGVDRFGQEEVLTPQELVGRLTADPTALALGPAMADYRGRLEALGAPPEQLGNGPPFPSALSVAQLARFPDAWEVSQLFSLEPHYVHASAAERNPKFPPLPGPAPAARIRED